MKNKFVFGFFSDPDCYQLVYNQRLINTTLIPGILDLPKLNPSKTNDR